MESGSIVELPNKRDYFKISVFRKIVIFMPGKIVKARFVNQPGIHATRKTTHSACKPLVHRAVIRCFQDAELRAISATGVPASALRNAVAICSSE